MRIPRIFIELPLRVGAEFDLDRAAAHYLLQVLRLRPGASLTLFNGDGRDYQGQLAGRTGRSARVRISGRTDREPPPVLAIHLGLGLSKGDRMDFAVQKSVELGVAGITPLRTEHSVVRLSAQRLANRGEHWRRIAVSACEQSGRRIPPVVGAALALNDWLSTAAAPGGTRILLDHRAPLTLDRLSCSGARVHLLVGPEGGLSARELGTARAAGFQEVRLGPRIMRTETAPLAAIAALQMLWGDFRET